MKPPKSSVKLVHKDSDLQCCIIHAVLLKTNNYGLSKMSNTIYRINRLQWVAVSFPCFEFLFINLIKVWRFISIMRHLKGFCVLSVFQNTSILSVHSGERCKGAVLLY